MPKVIVDGILVDVEANLFDEFCDNMKENNHQVSETKVCFTLFYFNLTFLISITFAKMCHY
uniref:Uncharacterized protein n=1 Tax=Heterorhabditis bacteriophora TaxID=37862 RepID=A0A1I7WFG6_HETBA